MGKVKKSKSYFLILQISRASAEGSLRHVTRISSSLALSFAPCLTMLLMVRFHVPSGPPKSLFLFISRFLTHI